MAEVWIRLALVLLASLLLLGGLRSYQRVRQPNPEWMRKLLHLGAGLLALSMPFLFHEVWPVLVVGAVYAATLFLLRRARGLREGAGDVLHNVSRSTVGEFAFVVAMCLIYILAQGDIILYVIPLMILAAADAAAALVGIRYGRFRYASEDGEKSAEGSVAFFMVAFFCVHVPLLLFTGIGRVESLLLAVLLAVIVMLSEAVSWNGLDNLVVPVVAFMLLKLFINETAPWLALHLVVIAGLALLVRVWREHTSLAADALMGAVLLGYVVWVIGGWRWLVAPIMVFSTYTALSEKVGSEVEQVFHIRVLLSVSSGALIWLTLYSVVETPQLFYAFTGALAGNFVIIALVRHKHALPDASASRLLFENSAKGAIILVPSIIVMAGFTASAFTNLLLGLVAVFIGSTSFYLIQPAAESYPVDTARWLRQALASGAASVVCLAPLLTPYLRSPPW